MMHLKFFILLGITNWTCLVYVQSDVRLPPEITVQPKSTIIYQSDAEVLVECEARGVPDVEYNWKMNGEAYDFNRPYVQRIAENKGSFIIKPATSLAEGYYQCFAKNIYGTAVSQVSALHRAVLAPYPPSSTEQEYRVDEGDPLKVTCLQTKSFPPPEYRWSVANNIADKIPINVELSNRIQQDVEGNLYFANVQGSDMQGGKVYRCSIYNQEMELTTIGSNSKIVVNHGSPASSRPSNVFHTHSPSIGIVGTSIELNCLFSGFPTPNVKWTRVGGSLPIGRHEKIDFGTTLRIIDLRFEDEGDYRCEGTNSVDEEDAIIQLDIQAVPIFKKYGHQPHNMNKTEGENAIFLCSADGEPTPQIQWFKNGVALDPNTPGPRMTISADHKNLTIHNVCKDCGNDVTDLMVIQCNASNVNGFAYSEGYLNVLLKTEKVHISLSIVTDDSRAKSALLSCESLSDDSTPIFVRWFLNGVEIDQNRPEYGVVPGGLYMFPYKMKDPSQSEGLYTCEASNGWSTASARIQFLMEDFKDSAMFTKYSPSYGPVAGGTVISLFGDVDPQAVKQAVLKFSVDTPGDMHHYQLDCELISDHMINTIQFKTPAVNASLAGLQFVIHIILNGGSNKYPAGEYVTGKIFEYKENPVISSISPKDVFLRGGLEMTITGQFLDSVANPVMYIYMERRLYNHLNNTYKLLETQKFRSEDTNVYNSTTIIGIAPQIDIANNRKENRSKRQNHDDKENIPINSESIEFFVGFELDGVETFKNVSESIDPEAGRIVVYNNPAVHKFQDVLIYDPATGYPIEILGERLNLGASMKDYIVSIGDGLCHVVEMTENQMFCEPPESEPNVVTNVRAIKGKPAIKVSVGYYNFHVGHIDYVDDKTTLFIIIGAVIAVIVLIFVIASVVMVCRKRRGKDEYSSVSFHDPK